MNKKAVIVSTCLNEISNVEEWICDINKQTESVEEIVVVDAGSTDGTYEILKEWERKDKRVKIILMPKASVAKGRNIAIGEAKSEIIISTDMGCKIDKDWAHNLLQIFEDKSDCDIVAGNYRGLPPKKITSWYEIDAILNNHHYPIMDDKMIPSSRSIAYKKTVWIKLSGYPEDLTYAADDMVFGLQARAAGYKIDFSPKAFVGWLRPERLAQYTKEFKGYAFGEGEALIFCPKILKFLPNCPDIILRIAAMIHAFLYCPKIIHLAYNTGKLKLVPLAVFYKYICRYHRFIGYKNGIVSGDRKCHNCRDRIKFN